MKILLLVLIMALPFTAHAATTPISVSIVDPVQFPPSNWDVTGLRANLIYGNHRNVYGIDVGVVNRSKRFAGVSAAALANINDDHMFAGGFQFAGIANVNRKKAMIVGAQVAAVANYNHGESSVIGVQLALANLTSHTTINGIQLGLYNSARTVRGLQIGVINRTQNLTGIQIGLMNVYEKGTFKYSPILNAGF